MRHWLALVVAIDVTVSAAGGASSYELVAGGAQKRGQISGPGGVSDSITVSETAPVIPVTLRFFDADGIIASCPRVDVAVQAGRPACRPRFVLTSTQLGYRQYLCELTCEALPNGGTP